MSEIAHYGVKGMKWGVHKAPRNKAYTRGERFKDLNEHGNGGVRRINKRMNKGQDLETARKNEVKFRKRRKIAIKTAGTIALYAHPKTRENFKIVWEVAGPVLAQGIQKRAATKRGQAKFADLMGIAGPMTYTKMKRGVYNISSL